MKVESLFAKYGCSVDRTDDRGKHVKYYLRTPSGPQIMVCSRSASDHRAIYNTESLLRRWSKT